MMKNPFKTGSEPISEPISAEYSDEKSPSPDVERIEAARADLERIRKAHQWDPNLPKDKLDAVNAAIQHGDPKELLQADELFTEDSPYEEVRAAVRNTDGEEVANTLRAWILGMFFVTIGSGLNMFLSMTYDDQHSRCAHRLNPGVGAQPSTFPPLSSSCSSIPSDARGQRCSRPESSTPLVSAGR